jgi:hypothetical protein
MGKRNKEMIVEGVKGDGERGWWMVVCFDDEQRDGRQVRWWSEVRKTEGEEEARREMMDSNSGNVFVFNLLF